MSPPPVAKLVAELLAGNHPEVRLLDAGARVGSLSAAAEENKGTFSIVFGTLRAVSAEIGRIFKGSVSTGFLNWLVVGPLADTAEKSAQREPRQARRRVAPRDQSVCLSSRLM